MATPQKASKGKTHSVPKGTMPKTPEVDPAQREAEKVEHNRRESDRVAAEKAMQFSVQQMATPAAAPDLKVPEEAMQAFQADLKALQEKHGIKVEVAKPKTAKSDKVQQNSITRPGRDTLCGKIWAAADEVSHTAGRPATIQEVKTKMHGTNDHTIKTQYARWRAFNGIKGRQVVATEPEPSKTEA